MGIHSPGGFLEPGKDEQDGRNGENEDEQPGQAHPPPRLAAGRGPKPRAAQQPCRPDAQYQYRYMPEKERHDDTVQDNHAGPDIPTFKPLTRGPCSQQQNADLEEAERQQRNVRRAAVRHDGARHGDHADRIGQEEDYESEPEKAGQGQYDRPRGLLEIALSPGISELMHRHPDEPVIQPSYIREPEQNGDRIRQAGASDKSPERNHPVPSPGSIADRHRKGNHHIDGEEPDRNQGEPGGVAGQPDIDFRAAGEKGRQRPEQNQRNDRRQQPPESFPQPEGCPKTASVGGRPGRGVRVAADKKEHRHDLKQPGQKLGPGREGQHIVEPKGAVFNDWRRRHPVAHNHRANRCRPQEIDIAISRARSLVGKRLGGFPEFHLRYANLSDRGAPGRRAPSLQRSGRRPTARIVAAGQAGSQAATRFPGRAGDKLRRCGERGWRFRTFSP